MSYDIPSAVTIINLFFASFFATSFISSCIEIAAFTASGTSLNSSIYLSISTPFSCANFKTSKVVQSIWVVNDLVAAILVSSPARQSIL